MKITMTVQQIVPYAKYVTNGADSVYTVNFFIEDKENLFIKCKRPLNPIPILIRFRFPAVWQQFFNLGHFVCRQPFQHITEIGIRIQPIQLC